MALARKQIAPAKVPRSRVELHLHLEGSVRISTLRELAVAKGLKIGKNSTYYDLTDAVEMKKQENLSRFLVRIGLYTPIFWGDEQAIERIAYELAEDQARQGVLYFEVRYAPQPLASIDSKNGPKLNTSQVVEAVQRGLVKGQEEFGVVGRSILCCLTARPEWAEEVLDLCVKYKNKGVVGIDVAGDETPLEGRGMFENEIVNVFRKAKELDIHRTCHAGEDGPASNVKQAVDVLNAQRIGHGYHVVEDEDVYRYCIEKEIHFETCPSSSYFTGAVPSNMNDGKHPVVQFAEDKVSFSINKDDSTITQTTLDDEYGYLVKLGLTEAHFVRANIEAMKHAFVEEENKVKLLHTLMAEYGIPHCKANRT